MKKRAKSQSIPVLFICMALLAALGIGLGIAAKSRISSLTAEKQLLKGELDSARFTIASLENELSIANHLRGGIYEHGRLQVIGSKLCDAYGNELQLRGCSSHGITWYPEYTSYAALKSIRDYGANVFRIAMYVEQKESYSELPSINKKLVLEAIENCLAADIYVIVDWHVLKDQNPNLHISEAISFFDEISSRYANNPGIIYEICNEPNGSTSWKDIRRYADKVIPVIRKNSPDAVIIVGTPNYSSDLSSAAGNPLPYGNVMYALHFYIKEDNAKSIQDKIESAIRKELPVFISEWGFGNTKHEEKALESAAELMTFLRENNISWVAWALSNKDESHAMIKNEVNALSGWEIDDFTAVGQFTVNAMK